VVALVALGGAATLCVAGCHDIIEEHFSSPPDRAVTWTDSNPADDNDPPESFPAGEAPRCSGAYTFFYPTDLGGPDGTARHPVLTWGNGTNSNACAYSSALTTLARWGYVVIAANSPSTGDGTQVLAAAQHMLSENSNPASVFFNKLDTAKFASIGHSQGAGGAVKAAIASNNLIKTVVTLSLSDPVFFTLIGQTAPDTSLLSVPIFFVRGGADFIASEPGSHAYWDGVPGGAAKASLKGADHNNLTAAGGYVTAWLEYTLKGDGYARGAFVGDPPEIAERGDDPMDPEDPWADVELKNLP